MVRYVTRRTKRCESTCVSWIIFISHRDSSRFSSNHDYFIEEVDWRCKEDVSDYMPHTHPVCNTLQLGVQRGLLGGCILKVNCIKTHACNLSKRLICCQDDDRRLEMAAFMA